MPTVSGLTLDTIPIQVTAIPREGSDIGEKTRGIIAAATSIITNARMGGELLSKNIFSAVGLSLLLLLGSGPAVLLAHDGHTHKDDRGGSRGEREDAGRYDPRYDEDCWEDEEDEEDEDDGSSTKPSPPPDRERRTSREQKNLL
jgi:hypothetical protein